MDSSAAIYSPLTLALYDAWVLKISNDWAWQCPTRSVLLPFFQRHVRQRHLDIGVGTGYYLAKAQLPEGADITLMDINPASLGAAARRIAHLSPRLLKHDAFTSLDSGQAYDSISLFYLLHCLPGPMAAKSRIFATLKHNLAPDGVLFGATILGDAAGHNGFGRKLMGIYNRKGVFDNRGDTAEGFSSELDKHFERVELQVTGRVLLFAASQPRMA